MEGGSYMRIYHFALLFLAFFLAVVLSTDLKIGKLKSVENEKKELTQSLDTATSDAINYLARTGSYGTNTVNRAEVLKTFYTSLYTSMGIISDNRAKEEVELYIPVILLCDMDGYYAYYYDEYKTDDGSTYSKRKWSEKMPYYYEDNYFVYRFTLSDVVTLYDVHHLLGSPKDVLEMDYHELQTEDSYKSFRNSHGDCIMLNKEKYQLAKTNAITNQLEKVMQYYTNKYNSIAKNNGITYNFSFPSKEQGEWAQYINRINLIVVFQGYPYGVDHNYQFNKVASAGADVIKKEVYYVEKKGWFYLAHRAGCPKLEESTTVLEETFESLKDCAAIGAYCCDECMKHGSRVPEIK